MYNNYVDLECEVVRGCGEGALYVKKDYYFSLLRSLLGLEPFPGTLNLNLISPIKNYSELCSICKPSFKLETIHLSSTRLGGVIAWYGLLMNIPCLIIRPMLSRHRANIIEVIASMNLRNKLKLKDGSRIKLRIFCSKS